MNDLVPIATHTDGSARYRYRQHEFSVLHAGRFFWQWWWSGGLEEKDILFGVIVHMEGSAFTHRGMVQKCQREIDRRMDDRERRETLEG